MNKIICIDNENQEKHLTVNKIYELIDISEFGDTCFIMDDTNHLYWYNITRFISLKKHRLNKIKRVYGI